MNCWLMKTEPDTFSIDDLAARPDRMEAWDGVRNYQARNFIRQMRPGDEVLIYHSSCPQPAIVGIAEVAGEPRPDPTQFNPKSPGFDPRSKPDEPRWYLVDVRYREHLARPVTLARLKAQREDFNGLLLLDRGRLSVLPVSKDHRERILALCAHARMPANRTD